MPREKSRYRDKRSSSYSSESSYERKKSRSVKHKRRSRSREKSESSSQRRRRSTSRSKYRRRSYSRSVSRERYESKSRRRSVSRSKSKRSRHSRDRSRSHSSTRSRSKHSKSKKHRRRSRSSSRSSSFDIEKAYPAKSFINLDATETQVEKAIKAAEAAGVTLTKIPTYEYKEVEVKADMPTIHDRNVLDDINSDSFVQQSFTSSRSKKQTQSIVIDLNTQTVTVPESDNKTENNDSIINFAEIPSEAERKEMWVKKLYQLRKKMLRGEI